MTPEEREHELYEALAALGYERRRADAPWELEGPHTRMIADSSLEALGLAVLAGRQPPDRVERYWWRVDGPDLYVPLIAGEDP